MKDYLAIIYIATGSSHARGPDLDDCVMRVTRTFASDWSSLFEVRDKEVKVACYDVTGHDGLYWDHRGVFAMQRTPKEDLAIPLLEVRTARTPKAKNRRRA